MKLKKNFQILISCSIVIALLWLSSCRDKEVDPCKNLQPTSAAFRMEEFFLPETPRWKKYDTDTVANLSINFTAVDSLADSYEWHIGAGVYATRSKSLSFPLSITGSSVSVMLIVKKKPNTTCFPKDDGVDTVTRKLYFADQCKGLVQGDFFGYRDDNKADTATITIKLCQPYYDLRHYNVYINNLYPGCSTFYDDCFVGFRQILPFGNGYCQDAGGHSMTIEKDNKTASFYYALADPTFTKWTLHHFIGIKKN